jgi:hypothetical protein
MDTISLLDEIEDLIIFLELTVTKKVMWPEQYYEIPRHVETLRDLANDYIQATNDEISQEKGNDTNKFSILEEINEVKQELLQNLLFLANELYAFFENESENISSNYEAAMEMMSIAKSQQIKDYLASLRRQTLNQEMASLEITNSTPKKSNNTTTTSTPSPSSQTYTTTTPSPSLYTTTSYSSPEEDSPNSIKSPPIILKELEMQGRGREDIFNSPTPFSPTITNRTSSSNPDVIIADGIYGAYTEENLKSRIGIVTSILEKIIRIRDILNRKDISNNQSNQFGSEVTIESFTKSNKMNLNKKLLNLEILAPKEQTSSSPKADMKIMSNYKSINF